MRFLKVFLSAVFLFAFFNAQAQPITGAFGLKLGEHLPNWVEGESKAVLTDFKDDFFDTVEYFVLPHTKRLYRIQAQKEDLNTNICKKVLDPLISVLRDKYSEYEITPKLRSNDFPELRKPGSNDFDAKDGDRRISLACDLLPGVVFSLRLTYEDASLSSEFSKEEKFLEKRKIDASKL